MNSSLANNNELMLISFDKPIQQERETGWRCGNSVHLTFQ